MVDSSIGVAALALVGAVVAGATARSRPFLALGVVFLLASMSRITLETPVGAMRLEQPAIAVVAVVLLVAGRFRFVKELPRWTLLMAMAFATYLAVLAISSALIAPQPAVSLRLVAWLAISMLGGVVALALAQVRPTGSVEPLALVGAANGAGGLVLAALFLVAGPAFDLGVQEATGIVPRVFGFVWEANLYASFLAICLPLGLEAMRIRRWRLSWAIPVLILIGLPLGVTRSAYLALAGGLAAYAIVRLSAERKLGDIPRLMAVAAGAIVVGIVASNLLLPNLVERITGVVGPMVNQPSATMPAGSGGSPGPMQVPLPSLAPYPDTVGFRLERVPLAIEDIASSPLIGLGAESFGQRHADASQAGLPDHLAILAVDVLYDAGIIGVLALCTGFGLLLWGLVRVARQSGRMQDRRTVGAAAAFTGSLVAMLIAYQATNALHFAINWIVVGAAAAVAVTYRQPESSAAR